MQRLAVDPSDGSAYVLFYDRRDDPDNVVSSVTLARSTDGGRTYVNYAWSDQTSDARKASFGDYLGLAAQDGRVYGAWVENAPANEAAKKQEPQTRPNDHYSEADCPSGPSTLRIGIADFRTEAGLQR